MPSSHSQRNMSIASTTLENHFSVLIENYKIHHCDQQKNTTPNCEFSIRFDENDLYIIYFTNFYHRKEKIHFCPFCNLNFIQIKPSLPQLDIILR